MLDRNQNKMVEDKAAERQMSKADIQNQRKFDQVEPMDIEDTVPEPGTVRRHSRVATVTSHLLHAGFVVVYH